jgi:signal peptidase II
MQRKWGLFAGILVVGVAIDVLTKRWAMGHLQPGLTTHTLGGLMPLTLSFNRGIAFGLHLGAASRVIFTVVGIVVLIAVGLLYHATPADRRVRLVALALMCAGAVGNLIDRIAYPMGVVDFLGPVDLRFMEWPIFNCADCFVTVGTLVLALALATDRGRHRLDSSSLQIR